MHIATVLGRFGERLNWPTCCQSKVFAPVKKHQIDCRLFYPQPALVNIR